MRRSTIAGVLTGLALLVPLTACGGEDKGSDVASISGGTETSAPQAPEEMSDQDIQEAMLEYAGCMRDHGVDMPDPGQGGAMPAMPAGDADPEFERAHEECRSALPNGGERPELSPEEIDEMRKQAKCLREHGLDVKVPTAENPGLAIPMDSNDPKAKKAFEACGMGGAVTRMEPAK
ncbi:hypothetical protein [Amycolatopsis aidingensis]|uniref:hypothetical protein n=1 Tax=Amycolatopsis aidingensis TaxID=2842453 RepID=UPI001C0BDBBE|nr:hypothetical protein [Amycolatopsis aidingensis]